MVLRRGGEPFWDALVRAGVPVTVFRVPANFPPSPAPSAPWACRCGLRAFAGMGTPDLSGTYGTFTLFAEGEYRVPETAEGGGAALAPGGQLEVDGGRIVSIALDGGAADLTLEGPDLDGVPHGATVRLHLDPDRGAVHLEAGRHDLVLRQGEWSRWVRLDFGPRPGGRVRGIARFYARDLDPLTVYATPVNLDPTDPLMPISVPEDAAADLAAATGLHYTQGMPADTRALDAGAIDEGEFLAQLELAVAEREGHLDAELARFEAGLQFFYVHSLDPLCHVLWRAADPDHPGHAPRLATWAGAIDAHYERIDRLLGHAVDALAADGRPPARLLVLSDHGFAPFARAVSLNRWLVEAGWLVPAAGAPAEPELLVPGQVDWAATRAYGLGLNGLYLNLAGREPQGAVAVADTARVLERIAAGLLSLRDPQTGAAVVRQVDRTGGGPYAGVAPDLVVGYARGYRASGASALGRASAQVLADNLAPWSGDHCMAASEVPGVLLSSVPFAARAPALWDVPVSLLALYGLDSPPGAEGHSIWRSTP